MKQTRREKKDDSDRPRVDTSAAHIFHSAGIHLSLILIVAGLAQMVIGWLKSHILVQTVLPQPQSSLIANRFYLDTLLRFFLNSSPGATPGLRVEYVVCVLIALLSAVPVYFVTRRWLGSVWALVAGFLYVVYPSFAWFITDTGPLALFIFLVPMLCLLLLRWETSQDFLEAFFLGISLALMTLINFVGLFLLLIITTGVCLHQPRTRRNLIGVMVILLGYALLIHPARSLLSTADRVKSETAMTIDFWNAIDNADGSAIAKAARSNKTSSPHPFLFLRDQARESPSNVIGWVLQRTWRTLYLSSDDRLNQMVFFLQLLWLVPALWGFIVAWSCPERRWAAILAAVLCFSLWGMAAVVEPLARNLTPLLGIFLVFSLAGIRDISHRIARHRSLALSGKIKH